MRKFLIQIVVLIAASLVEPSSRCDVLINEKNINDNEEKSLQITSNKYQLSFGLNLKNNTSWNSSRSSIEKNEPIGYSIEAECYNMKNVSTKTRAYYSHDLNNIPIEIFINNCSGAIYIEAPELNQQHYLRFVVDFKQSIKNVSFFLHFKLGVNRRLGYGCSANLIMYPKTRSLFDLTDLFNENFGELFEYTEGLQRIHRYWNLIITNPFCIYSLILIGLVLILALVITTCCLIRKKSNSSRRLTIDSGLIKLNSIKRKSKGFDQLEETKPSTSKSEENKESGEQVPQTITKEKSTIKPDKPSSKSIKDKSIKSTETTTETNEFQVVRNKLSSKGHLNKPPINQP